MNYYRLAQSKYKKALRISRLLRYIPGVKMIAVCNSLSYNRAALHSDIDLFIITAKGSIWTARFFSLLVLKLLRLRPRLEQPSQDKVCLSFFISESNLNLEKYKICVQDSYLAFWIKQLKPLYIENNLYKKFVQANQWAPRLLGYDTAFYIPNYKRRLKTPLFKFLLNFLVIGLAEKIYKHIQLRVMPSVIKDMACAWDSRVVVSNKILKFHLNDRRMYFRDEMSNYE